MRPGTAQLIRELPGPPIRVYVRPVRYSGGDTFSSYSAEQCPEHEAHAWAVYVEVSVGLAYHLEAFNWRQGADDMCDEVDEYIRITNNLKWSRK